MRGRVHEPDAIVLHKIMTAPDYRESVHLLAGKLSTMPHWQIEALCRMMDLRLRGNTYIDKRTGRSIRHGPPRGNVMKNKVRIIFDEVQKR